MTSKAYDKAGIEAVIVKIDPWLKDEDPEIQNFKKEVAQYLKTNESLDKGSFEWALNQIDDCKINETERIQEFLEELQLFLRIDLRIEEGRECLVDDERYAPWIGTLFELCQEYGYWDREAFDDILDSLSREYKTLYEAVAFIRERLEMLKRNIRGM